MSTSFRDVGSTASGLPALPAGSADLTTADARWTPRAYLRRYAVRARRPRYARIALLLILLGSLLFAKVWESTVANTLSMERDRLRRDVRALTNRIRLSSELGDQAALRQGIDSQELQGLGFIAPDPSSIIDIDLDQAIPRAIAHGGVVARLGAWLHGLRPFRPAPAGPEAVPLPVRAAVAR